MLKVLKNKIFVFIFTRYLSYFIQFLNSLIIAYFLGPYYLGVWGFISVILQYLSYGNLGLDNALNVTLSTGNILESKKQSQILSNALIATVLTGLILISIGFFIYAIDVHFFEKYLFSRYMFFIIVISCLNYLNVLFINLFRTYSLYTPIVVFQLSIQLLQLPICFLLKSDMIISGLLSMTAVAHVISFFVFIKKMPIKVFLKVDFNVLKTLYKRGVSLLFYNVTFNLLMLSTRSVIGYFYPVETMGFFTFASNIATALIVGLSSLEFILFPKMLNRLSADTPTDKSIKTFHEVRYIYMATVYLIIILGLICYPILLFYFKKFSDTINVFSYLVICQIVLASGFGYSTLIIARGKELFLVLHGLIALLLNLTLSIVGYSLYGFDYSFMALFLVISFVYYDAQVIRKGRELLNLKGDFYSIIADLFPAKSIVSLAFLVVSIVTKQYLLFYIFSFLSFFVFNFRGFTLIKKYILTLLNQPSIINIK